LTNLILYNIIIVTLKEREKQLMTTIYNELKETMKEAYGTEVLPEKVVTSIMFKTNISLDVEQTLKLTHETIFNDPIHLTFYTKDFIFKIINLIY